MPVAVGQPGEDRRDRFQLSGAQKVVRVRLSHPEVEPPQRHAGTAGEAHLARKDLGAEVAQVTSGKAWSQPAVLFHSCPWRGGATHETGAGVAAMSLLRDSCSSDFLAILPNAHS